MKKIIQMVFILYTALVMTGCAIRMKLPTPLPPHEKIGVLSTYGKGANSQLNPVIANSVVRTLKNQGYSPVLFAQPNGFELVHVVAALKAYELTEKGNAYLQEEGKKQGVNSMLLITDDPYTTEIGYPTPLLAPRDYHIYYTGIASGKTVHIFKRFKVYFINISTHTVIAHQFGMISLARPFKEWEDCQYDTPQSEQRLAQLIAQADSALLSAIQDRIKYLMRLPGE